MSGSSNASTLPERLDHVHFIAIGGTGMGSLARLLAEAGHHVRGSDEAVYPPMSSQLENAGIEIIEGFSAANLDPRPDLADSAAPAPSPPERSIHTESGGTVTRRCTGGSPWQLLPKHASDF